MKQVHQPDEVVNKLIRWGEQHDSIRAMLLTSTRAVPNAPIDALSDYDVILIVKDIHPFFDDRSWLKDFGKVVVEYWDPIYPDHSIEMVANVIQYSDGLKLDFTLWPVKLLQKIIEAPTLPAELDAGYRVLLDKDHLADEMALPTYKSYIPTPPTSAAYEKTIEDFFSDVPCVAKGLLREELFPVKWALDYDMKHLFLRIVLEWLVEIDHDWSLPVGALGKGLKKQLPPEIWSQLEETYVGADIAETWEALFKTITLFRRVAMEVGKALGHAYPQRLDERVTKFAKEMQRSTAS